MVFGLRNDKEEDTGTPFESVEYQRQGKLFFGLCDMRNATIAVNCINIVVILIGLLFHLIMYFGFMPVNAAIPAFVLSMIAIFGAVNFELWGVALASVGFLVGLLVDLWWINIFGIIMGVLVLYPTATMAHQLHKGILTKETLEREEFIDYETAEKAGIKKEYIDSFNRKVSHYMTSTQELQ